MKLRTLLNHTHFTSLVEIMDEAGRRLYYGEPCNIEMKDVFLLSRVVDYQIPFLAETSEEGVTAAVQIWTRAKAEAK